MLSLNTIHRLDCIDAMDQLEAGCVDLAFADPPFNIGYEYDVYHDKKDARFYLEWSRKWITGVHQALKPEGTFWLAIGDEYAAELKLLCQEIGFHCRSWVVWYYTFGVNCKYKFSRSHVHLFHFVKDKKKFTFVREAILIPSARQLVYADKRAAEGRLPDDTWTLRPQDLADGFNPDEDVWYFPRVAGTFKEREGFHGCQMPEQLLGRIVKACSHSGDLVLDPFSGSATTLAVAKKLTRRFIGFDISEEYIGRGLSRLEAIEPGDPLDGSPEPTISAPKTPSYNLNAKTAARRSSGVSIGTTDENAQVLDEATGAGIIEAFRRSSQGYSPDRVVADPDLNKSFIECCNSLGLPGDAWFLNRSLFRLRKAGKVTSQVPTTRRTEFNWSDTDPYLFASEIAWRKVSDLSNFSLDDIICNPVWAREFDDIASQFAPGYSPLEYRWAAFKLRKELKVATIRSIELSAEFNLSRLSPVTNRLLDACRNLPGLYLVTNEKKSPLYAGESLCLDRLLEQQFGEDSQSLGWQKHGKKFLVSLLPYRLIQHCNPNLKPDRLSRWLLACQISLIRQNRPLLNRLGLDSAAV